MKEYDYEQHSSILQYSNAFRVLKVHPGKWEAPIECNLLVRRLRAGGSAGSTSSILKDSEPFDALSYHWGLPETGYSVKILAQSEAFRIAIRSNLDSALRHLRHEENDVYLWVDALCINQDDNTEKSAQIPLLHYIYNQAETVRVWIGGEENDSDRAMDFVKRCLNMEAFDRLVRDSIASQDWAALSALMRRPWFSRRWVIQEIAHARSAVLHCGSRWILWRDFASAVSMLSRRQPQLRKLFRESSGYGNHPDYLGDLNELGAIKLADLSDNICRKLADGTITEKMFSLEALVSSLTTFEASDPHDILYAILWLANDAHPVTRKAYRPKTQRSDESIQEPTPATAAPSPAELSRQTSLNVSEQRESWNESRADLPSDRFLTTLSPNMCDGRRRASSEAPRGRTPIPTLTVNDGASHEAATETIVPPSQHLEQLETINRGSAHPESRSDPSIAAVEERFRRGRPASNSVTSNSSRSVRPRLSLSTSGRQNNQSKEEIAGGWFLKSLQNSRIFVDYNKTVFEVCKDFVEFAVKGTSSLDMLCKPWAPTNLPSGETLPTWMPQLSGSAFAPTVNGIHRRVNADPLVGTPGFPSGGPKPYRASCGLPATAVFSADNSRILQVKGFVLDWIRERKAPATGGNIPTEWMEAANWTDSLQLPPDLFWNTLVGNRDTNGRLPPRYWQTSCRDAFRQRPLGGVLNTQDILLNCPTLVAEFVERVQCMVWNRRLVLLERLKRQENDIALALAPGKPKKGDLICILHGCSVPVVLRKIVDGKAEVKRKQCEHPKCPSRVNGEQQDASQHQAEVHYELIGECYVHGMMNGEAFTGKRDGHPIQRQMFDLC